MAGPHFVNKKVENIEMSGDNPLQWTPVFLSKEKVEFDTNALEAEVQIHGQYRVTIADGLAKIESAG